jgi:hypothetical protein
MYIGLLPLEVEVAALLTCAVSLREPLHPELHTRIVRLLEGDSSCSFVACADEWPDEFW